MRCIFFYKVYESRFPHKKIARLKIDIISIASLYLLYKLFKGTLHPVPGFGGGFNEQHSMTASKFESIFPGDFNLLLPDQEKV